jgi:hypothetical protein
LLEPLLVAIERFGETLKLIGGANQLRRARPNGVNRRAGSKRFAVAIVYATAYGRDLRDPGIAGIALLLEKILIEEL